MGRRSAVPLYKTRHVSFVEAIHESDDSDKAMASHLAVGTGGRPYTIAHTHKSWFVYGEDGALYYRVPHSAPCHKYGNTSPCGDCSRFGHDEYEPKTPAGGGRRILLPNEWTNPVTREKEYFGLRDAVESYFALDGPRSPKGVQYGNEMLDGNGISAGHLNDWIRDIGAQSSISAALREDWLHDVITIEDPKDDRNEREVKQIQQFGTDDDGNEIPDIIAHDMRATYCTQLMRNDVSRTKAINKTGHAVPDSMNPYVHFAEKEIDSSEESDFY
jgi:hypothetical protein